MTCRVTNNSNVSAAIELLCEQGLEGLGDVVSLLINQAMELERSRHLQAAPYERTADRQGHANGYKSKSVKTRVGQLDLRVPQEYETLAFIPAPWSEECALSGL